jgi:hypothetical protein
MTEHEERMSGFAQRWPAGERGPAGPRGRRGMPAAVTWAVVLLFVISFAMATTGLYLSLRAITMDHHHDALCTALGQLAREKPPAGNPVTNPSRAYAQQQHATFTELHSHFGCG